VAKIRARSTRVTARDTRAVRPPAKTADPFYLSPEWRRLVAFLIRRRGRRCETQGCGRTHDADGQPIRIFGDHIVERRDGGAPLDPANIRLVCGSCHTAKTAAERARRAAETF
jgi:5-methylcytosine-specific restriction endonuclease McrA